MGISLVIYLMNKKFFPNPQKVVASGVDTDAIKMDAKEVKQRLYALFAVFGVVIFFWLSFHQNGLTLTFFAKEYTDLSSVKVSLGSLTLKGAEIFQSINPFFVVFLTPIVLSLFGWLRARGKEPSTPKKIAIGMAIAAAGFLLMTIGSYVSNLPLHSAINPEEGGVPLAESLKVTPFLLIGTYFILTVAELFISPLGISFVSKVAPPQYQGVMQGGWLGATAVGNSLLFVGAVLYDNIPIWMTWSIFVIACSTSMLIMIFMLKWLERIAK
jgi:POT family proton-dependent oligopeptide transporter